MMFELLVATLALYALAWTITWALTRATTRAMTLAPRRAADGAADQDAPAATIAALDALLPQTQCRDCGYPGCLPYARAIVEQDAPLNLCPPGGAAVVRKLERLLGKAERRPAPPTPESSIALIDEETCIGCVKCIDACPVDAIVGSAKQLHAVIPAYCTGCKLCLPPCPVDCITMIPRHA